MSILPDRWWRDPSSLILAGALILAALFRIPALLSPRHLGYDDGVYGASVELMGAGYAPFRDFFFSQGPVYLLLLRIADLATPNARYGLRVAMMFTAALVALGTYLLARRYADRTVAAWVAVLAATSGALLAAAGPLQSDGVALVFATTTLAVLVGPGPSRRWRPLVVGALLGLGLMVKSLHLVPVALVIAVYYGLRRSWTAMATAAGSAVAIGLAVTLPWGIASVWDQYVAFHLDRPRTSWTSNVLQTVSLMGEHELPLLLLAVATLVAVGTGRRSLATAGGPDGSPPPPWLPLTWLTATLLVLLPFSTINPGFLRSLAFVAVPLLVIVAQGRPPVAVVALIAVAAVPYQWLASPITVVEPLHPDEAGVIARLDDLPASALVVSDEPGLGWVAQAMSHPATVDVSFGRISADNVSRADVATAIADPATCLVISWSSRFDALGVAPPGEGFAPPEDLGNGRWLAVRTTCVADPAPNP